MQSKIPKKVIWAFVVLSFLGFADATYLALLHYLGEIPPCSIVKGCEAVTTSSYSVVFGIPVALLGSAYYLSIFLLSVYALEKANNRMVILVSKLTWIGLIASTYFLFLQLFVIGAICLFCVGSIITSTLLWILGRYSIKFTV